MSTTSSKPPISTTSYHLPRPRRFAPLSASHPNTDTRSAPPLKGIIFDVDGTLCLPQNYMFGEMRKALGIPKSVDILEHVRGLSDEPDSQPVGLSNIPPAHACGDEDEVVSESGGGGAVPVRNGSAARTTEHTFPSSPRSRAVAKIQAIERSAMTSQTPQPGLNTLMSYLSSRQIRKALCTRNFPAPVEHLLLKCLPEEKFWPVITRETGGVSPKPSPEGLWSIARSWGIDKSSNDGAAPLTLTSTPESEAVPGLFTTDTARDRDSDTPTDPLEMARRHLGAGLIMVGDSIDDMAAGYRAGAATVLLVNEDNAHLVGHDHTDLVIKRLDELVGVLERGFEGRS